MNRRNFLYLLGASATGIVLPEPRRVYSFPSAWWLERERGAAGRIYSSKDISIRFGGVTMRTADGFEFDGEFFPTVPPEEGTKALKRTVAAALRRHQNYINLEALRGVVIRGKVGV